MLKGRLGPWIGLIDEETQKLKIKINKNSSVESLVITNCFSYQEM
jgi:hypothetical protein